MDVLYILGKGSPFNNEELKYSLRSLERFGSNVGRIIIVGEKPDFIDNTKVTHVPFNESGVKEYRIASKILHACTSRTVTGDFLFCNDDFFFMKSFDCNQFPFYHQGYLQSAEGTSGYGDHLKLTRQYLESKSKTTMHFDVHCPIIYNAQKFISLTDTWLHSRESIGMVVKSCYANMNQLNGITYKDVKLKQLITQKDYEMANLNECFSIYDQAWKKGVEAYLMHEFQDKSKWEL